jgi:signal transduction histidine kinase
MGERIRRQLGSVRVRAAIGSVVLVGLVLVGASIAFGALLRRSLVNGVRTTVEVLAADVAAEVEAGDISEDKLPALEDEEDALVQIVDQDQQVVVASEEIDDAAPIALAIPPGQREVVRILERPPFEDDDDFVVLARAVNSDRAEVVYVASTLEDVDETLGSVTRGLILGVPIVLLAVGATTWYVVGRALRPVETMRAEVAEISATALDRRVPEPPIDDEIGRLAKTMNVMLDRLQVAHDRQRRFVADASHELRSPLASTRAQLEVGLSQGEQADWPTTVGDVLGEHHRMERLVDELLFMARVADGAGNVRRVPVDLDDLVLSEVARLRGRGGVNVDISGVSAGRVSGDPDHLAQVVRNLLDNAERHAATSIWVELSTSGPTVELIVADDGDGIPVEDRERVFERFTRLDAARARQDGGAGLGLAIARAVVESHGGRIEVLDSGNGTRIAVRLPSLSVALT